MTLKAFSNFRLKRRGIVRLSGGDKCVPCILLFSIRPLGYVGNRTPPRVLASNLHGDLLKRVGMNTLRVSFSRVVRLSPRDFIHSVLIKEFSTKTISYNRGCAFKSGNSKGIRILHELYQGCNVRLCITPVIRFSNVRVDSAHVERTVEDNSVRATTGVLNEPFSCSFAIITKSEHNRLLNFPAVGRFFPSKFIRPGRKICTSCMRVNNGTCPTIAGFNQHPAVNAPSIHDRAYVLNFSNSLCNASARIRLLRFLQTRGGFSNLSSLSTRVGTSDRDTIGVFRGAVTGGTWGE